MTEYLIMNNQNDSIFLIEIYGATFSPSSHMGKFPLIAIVAMIKFT